MLVTVKGCRIAQEWAELAADCMHGACRAVPVSIRLLIPHGQRAQRAT